VVFVCEHGTVKSVVGALQPPRARERGLAASGCSLTHGALARPTRAAARDGRARRHAKVTLPIDVRCSGSKPTPSA
jgi:hypothetical protein